MAATAIPAQPPPPAERLHGRNADWRHVYNARHHLDAGQVGVSVVRGVGSRVSHDPARAQSIRTFAKEQLVLLLREWYMHPNGQIPGVRVRASAT